MIDLFTGNAAEDNVTRAHLAAIALEAFGAETGQKYIDPDGTLQVEREILEEIGGDLLADLFHLVRRSGYTPDLVISAGLRHFEAEVEEEEAEEVEED
ncbi:hypothetical protein [Streptomyces sp. NPDC046976]|uniref:hypothetical protein n=1 Tax=Streptomyces sp. NPDC046976 TaxID=3155258 RepID=UPI0033C576E1